MKANQAFRNDKAEVGVGTLIVFIAMVLVAAVAAAVLINTTGSLQQRAESTGKDATQEVSSNLKVLNVYGYRNSTSTDLHKLTLSVEMSAGATSIDMQELVLRLSDGTSNFNYDYGFDTGNGFNLTWVRGDGTNQVMVAGDLVEIQIHTWPLVAGGLPERDEVKLTLVPEIGSSVNADFKTPPTYGSDTVITLR